MRTRITVLLTILVLMLGASSTPIMAAGSDEAQEATKFRDLPFSDFTDATAATGNPNDPNVCGNGRSTNSVWYRFQPKSDGPVTIDTIGSNYDTVLSVWTSSPGQSAQELAFVVCDDDGGPGVQSVVSFFAERNVTYFIMVERFGSIPVAGTLVLNAS